MKGAGWGEGGGGWWGEEAFHRGGHQAVSLQPDGLNLNRLDEEGDILFRGREVMGVWGHVQLKVSSTGPHTHT